MSLSKTLMVSMKEAMKAKDQDALAALRAIKSAILLAQTESGSKEELTEDQELKLLQKLVKQRKDSATIFSEQGREDLAGPELAQIEVISKFLPEQLGEEEVTSIVKEIIETSGAQGMKDMGKVMGQATARLTGKADGKLISGIVKSILS